MPEGHTEQGRRLQVLQKYAQLVDELPPVYELTHESTRTALLRTIFATSLRGENSSVDDIFDRATDANITGAVGQDLIANTSGSTISRRIAIASSGMITLVPVMTEPGDSVAFLVGGSVFYVLRPLADAQDTDDGFLSTKTFRLIGEAWFSKVVTPHLSFKRVFILANNHNIQVFRNIANHETFRHDVREIVWDDARFMVSLEEESDYHNVYGYDAAESDCEDTPVPEGVPLWFVAACRENIDYLRKWRGRDVETLPQHVETAQQLAAQLPLDVAYEYYRTLVRDQGEVLATATDSAAFEWALAGKRFPNLRRVTITPAAHGILFFPQYLTPMIRAFPYGFNYPFLAAGLHRHSGPESPAKAG
ncbi:hypothetical protein CGCVW01_v007723 [Colletotrichum viniferum]|nr:hypothetical protein CGCVW01_v007723 [Colletotrichum viniferum]